MSEVYLRDEQCDSCAKFSHCNNNDLVCIRKFQQLKQENERLKDELKGKEIMIDRFFNPDWEDEE